MAGIGVGFAALNLTQKLTRVGIIFGIILAIGGLFYWWLDSYGDRRYDEGVQATDQKWEEARERLKKQAEASATRADDLALNRLNDHVNDVAAEQEALDEAERTGSSPIDVLFGGGD